MEKTTAALDTYTVMKDEELLERIHNGDCTAQDYILEKYKNLVRIKSRAYFIIGSDREDIIQEGMIGLYKAIRDYNADKQVSFAYFAELCVTRQIITAIKAATRQKHIPLNSYVSLNKLVYDEETDKTYLDMLTSGAASSPEELLIGRETKDYIESNMEKTLSEMECRVLALYLQGESYSDIAALMSKDEKAIDNALQRVRRKVEKILSEKTALPKSKKRKKNK